MNYFDSFHSQLALPYLETHKELIQEIFKTLEQYFGLIKNSNQKLIDLGSGDGRIVIYSGLNFGIQSIGIEINEALIKESKDKIKSMKKDGAFNKKQYRNVIIKFGDIFRQNLEEFDFIYTYSLPTMHKYMNHVFITAKKDAIIISHKYPLKGFDLYLKLEHELVHKLEKEKLTTFFYKKI